MANSIEISPNLTLIEVPLDIYICIEIQCGVVWSSHKHIVQPMMGNKNLYLISLEGIKTNIKTDQTIEEWVWYRAAASIDRSIGYCRVD